MTSTSTLRALGAQRLAPGEPQRQPPARDAALIAACSSRASGAVAAGLVDDTPSRRNTTRSAQAACRASWVTSTPAAPASQRAAEQPQDVLAGLGVERAGRLVGQDQPALADEGPGDRDPLLLAAGHLVGEPVGERRRCRPRRAPRERPCGAPRAPAPSSSRGSATFSAAVSAGIRLKSWKT